MFIPIGLLESYIEILWRERWHVGPWTPPGLGRTQGCGFWADNPPMMWHMYAPTFNKWHKKKKKKKLKVTLHILTHGAMQCEGVGWLLWWLTLNKTRDIRERNVTIKSEIWTTNNRPLGFWDIREWVIIWWLILRSFGCTCILHMSLQVQLPSSR